MNPRRSDLFGGSSLTLMPLASSRTDLAQLPIEGTVGLTGLPSEAWCGWFDLFLRWVKPTTDAPFESIFAAGLQALSMAVGRAASISYGRETYCNLYSVIVGPPGSLRKSTTVSRARTVIREAFGTNFVCIARSAASGPGLLELFTEEELSGNRTILSPIPGQRVLLDEPEFTALLKKTRRKGTADLAEVLIDLYDGDDISPRTRVRPIRVEQPFFGIISTTTPENLDANLTGLDIECGLLPRFCLFYGVERPPMAYPAAPDLGTLRSLADGLRQIQRHAEQVGSLGMRRLEGDSRGLWTMIYETLSQRTRSTSGSVRAMLERISVHVIKLALLYALQAGHVEIEVEDLQRAALVGTYLAETALLVPGGLQEAPTVRVEAKLLEYLASLPGDEWKSRSEIHHIVGGRIKAAELLASLTALVALGKLEDRAFGSRGRRIVKYRLASDET